MKGLLLKASKLSTHTALTFPTGEHVVRWQELWARLHAEYHGASSTVLLWEKEHILMDKLTFSTAALNALGALGVSWGVRERRQKFVYAFNSTVSCHTSKMYFQLN